MERRELIERLIPLIPPPRAHQVRYHGVLAPSASLRDRIVPGQPETTGAGEPRECSGNGGPSPRDGSEVGAASPLVDDERPRTSEQTCEREMLKTSERDRGGAAPGIDAHKSRGRMRWAALLQRVFEFDALRCPRCGQAMRLIAAIEDPDVARRILECLKLPARAPPLADATAEPEESVQLAEDWDFDQSLISDEP
jgi:hypothetical protein